MMKKLDLHWQVLIAIVLGILFSFASIQFDFIQFTKDWISPIGDIFIRLLKLISTQNVNESKSVRMFN
jgi:Na+/H+-dicarboxylate symporter